MKPMTFEYGQTRVTDLVVNTEIRDDDGKEVPVRVEIDGEPMRSTPRFWHSLFHRFGLAGGIFRYFDYDEVFGRIAKRNADDQLRYCIERGGRGEPRLLAVSNPRRPFLPHDQATRLIARRHGEDVSCTDGVLRSRHVPGSGRSAFRIGPDLFNNRFVLEVPIDGFGQPRIFLSLLRQVCSNGAVGYSRSFRSDIRIGDDALHTLARALDHFDHDEGFAALRQRFESAQKSWASVREVLDLHRVVGGVETRGEPGRRGLLERLDRVSGDMNGLYGLANMDALSPKRQQVLPAKCRVYDLLNFASEVATHHAEGRGRLKLQAFIGTMVCDEYDLEGTAEKVEDFKELLVSLN